MSNEMLNATKNRRKFRYVSTLLSAPSVEFVLFRVIDLWKSVGRQKLLQIYSRNYMYGYDVN